MKVHDDKDRQEPGCAPEFGPLLMEGSTFPQRFFLVTGQVLPYKHVECGKWIEACGSVVCAHEIKEASLTRRLGRERIWRSTPKSMCHNPVHPGKALWFPFLSYRLQTWLSRSFRGIELGGGGYPAKLKMTQNQFLLPNSSFKMESCCYWWSAVMSKGVWVTSEQGRTARVASHSHSATLSVLLLLQSSFCTRNSRKHPHNLTRRNPIQHIMDPAVTHSNICYPK